MKSAWRQKDTDGHAATAAWQGIRSDRPALAWVRRGKPSRSIISLATTSGTPLVDSFGKSSSCAIWFKIVLGPCSLAMWDCHGSSNTGRMSPRWRSPAFRCRYARKPSERLRAVDVQHYAAVTEKDRWSQVRLFASRIPTFGADSAYFLRQYSNRRVLAPCESPGLPLLKPLIKIEHFP